MAPKSPTMAQRRGVKRQAEEAAVEPESSNEVPEEDLETPIKIKFNKAPSSYSDPAKKAQCIALWKRTARGLVKKATASDIDNAQKALDLMKELPQERQKLFVEAFVKQGKTKDFAFVRDYEETWRNTTEKTNSAIEGYMTRIFF
jgi:Holliday junction resolvase RusA-like endonuclease